MGQSPYKNPNPKWVRFVHFPLDLISAGPRSNHSPIQCLSTFQLLHNSFVHFVTSFLDASFPLFLACFPILRCWFDSFPKLAYSNNFSNYFEKNKLRFQGTSKGRVMERTNMIRSSLSFLSDISFLIHSSLKYIISKDLLLIAGSF
jgi:hypothetical protein